MLKTFHVIAIFLLLKFNFLSAFEDGITMPDHFANQDGIPSAIVNGVNVITGDYCEYAQDLINPGIAQLYFDRCNLSSNYSDGNFCNSWESNLGGLAKLTKEEHRKKSEFIILHKGAHGTYSTYSRFMPNQGRPHDFILNLDSEAYRKGLTNTGKQIISASTHPKNNIFHYNSHDKKLSLTSSDGTKYKFKYHSKNKFYQNIETKKLNKQSIRYTYEDNHTISKAVAYNSENEEISKLEINYDDKNYNIEIKGDGGANVRYKMYYYVGTYGIYWYIKDVISNRGPKISYNIEMYDKENTDARMRITHKFMPKNILHINYFKENKKLNINKFDKRINKVSDIFISDRNKGAYYRWKTSFKYAYDEPGKGGTTVLYPYKAPTDYFYDKYRLTKVIQKIENANKSYSHYLIQQLHWLDYKNYEGNLEKKVLLTGNNEFLESTSYFYDLKGNVLEEHYKGHLTGNSTFINPNECYIKKSTYYQDSRNLLESVDDGKKKIVYSYYDNTNLVKHKFVIANNKIQSRTFYEYDKNSALTLEVLDDGCSEDKNDLTGVTERHIKEIVNRTEFPVGLPKIIYSKYLNMKNGYEELLYRKEFNYTFEGWIALEETFNQNNELIDQQKYVYDSEGKVIETYDILGQGTFREYDKAGNVIKVQTPQYDFYTNYFYDYCNRLIKEEIVQSNGTILAKSCKYDDISDNKISETDIYGNDTKFTYDSLNRIIQKEMPSGEILRYEYNCRNQLISQIDHYGNRTTYEYTSRNQPICTHYPDGREEKFRYDLDGTLVIKQDVDGTITENTVDYLGRVIKKVVKSENGEYLFETRQEYNAFHLLKEIDAVGNETLYEYDSAGREIKVVKIDHVKETIYDLNNRISQIKTYALDDSDGIITKYEYDILNRVTCEQKCDLFGNVQSEQYFSYDYEGNVIETISIGHAGSSILKNQYDIFGNVLVSIDGEGNKTVCTYRYDYFNELGENVGYHEITDPLGNKTITIKNIAGQDDTIIYKDAFDKDLHKTTNSYNHMGLLFERIEWVYVNEKIDRKISKKIFYDHVGNIVGVINAVGTPLQRELYIAYNKYGQKSCLKKSDGTYLNYEYGPRGLLKEFSSSDGSVHYRYEYDRLDNLIKMTDVLSGLSTLREYNAHKQMICETLANDLEMKYSYYINNREKKVLFPDGSYFENHYKGSYLDKIKRFNAQNELQYQHIYEDYDKRGCYKSVQLAGNAGKIEFTYDKLGRLRSTQTKHWREVIAAFDEAGNLTQRELSNDYNSEILNYKYDSLYQLLSEKNHTYQYDSLHNRISKDGKLHDINDLNQVLYDGENNYEYDLCGNLTKINGQRNLSFSYDALDRLRCVEKERERYLYIYDGKNRRIAKEKYILNSEGSWQFCSKESYLYQNECEIGTVDHRGKIIALRIIGNGKGAEIGATIAMEIQNNSYVPIHDHQGNISSLISLEDGSLIESYEYSAFGEEIIYDSSHQEITDSIQPWHFASKRLDSETGFIYFGYRYYSRELGKWITSDPMGEKDGPNLYAYVKNRPYALFDSYGLFGEYFDDEIPYPYYHPDSLSNITACAGRGLGNTAYHCLPICGTRDYLEEVACNMQGVSYKSSYMEPHTIKVGDGQLSPGVYNFAITGIFSTTENTRQFAESVSESLNGHAVYGICLHTQGTVADLHYAALSYFGYETPNSQYVESEIKKFYSMALQESSDPILGIHKHSRGTMDSAVASKSFNEKVCNSIISYNYGGLISKNKNFRHTRNIMNKGDPLILLNPRHWFDTSEITWTTEPMSWNIIKNHYIMENGYQKAIKENGSEFYKNHRQK